MLEGFFLFGLEHGDHVETNLNLLLGCKSIFKLLGWLRHCGDFAALIVQFREPVCLFAWGFGLGFLEKVPVPYYSAEWVTVRIGWLKSRMEFLAYARSKVLVTYEVGVTFVLWGLGKTI